MKIISIRTVLGTESQSGEILDENRSILNADHIQIHNIFHLIELLY